MKLRQLSLLLSGVGLLGFQVSAHAAFITPTYPSGSPILSPVNPKVDVSPQPATCSNSGLPPTEIVQMQSSSLTTGKVNGLPGSASVPGYILKASRSAPLIINSVTVGTLYDRVYCLGTGTTCNATNTHILATRANLNTNVWNPSNQSFEINDFFRVIKSTVSGDIAYFMGTVDGGTNPDTALAKKFLEFSGRTQKGLGQTITRSNGWMAFRHDTNANDPDRCEPFEFNSPWSPWLYVRQVCSAGFNATPQNFKIKVREGGEEGQTVATITTSGYVCN